MKKDNIKLGRPKNLRSIAEERLRKSKAEAVQDIPERDIHKIFHELQVHQIELEIQNEELRRSREEIAAALERYTDLFDFAPVGHFTLDSHGIIKQVNLTGAKFLGDYRSSLINKRFSLLINNESRPVFNAFLQRVFEGKDKESCEVSIRKAGTAPCFVQIEATVADNGQECRAVAVEVSGSKLAADALRESQEQYSQLLRVVEEDLKKTERRLKDVIDFLPDATLAIDAEKKVTVWNKAIERMTGIKAEDMIGKGNYEYTIPFYGERRPQLMDLIWEQDQNILEKYPHVIREGDSLSAEAFFCSALYGGRGAYVFAKVSPIHDQKGNIVGAIESIRDITEHKKAEAALKKNEENFRNLIDRNPVAMAVADKSGKFIFFNNKFTKTFGYTMQDIPTVDDWWPLAYPDEEYRQRVINSWRTAAKKATMDRKETEPHEWRIKCKDGSFCYIEFRMASLEDRNIVIFHDITGLKQAQEEKQKLQDQLMQSQKMEAVGRLAGGIAHDFNNLMTAVIGYSDLILGELPEKHFARDKIRIVRDAGDKASALVKQLLAFTRNQILEMKPVNLNEIIWNMNNLFERTIGEDIELELNIDKPVKNVLADTGQIEQILMNLVVNARDAMPNGGRLIIETDSVYLDEGYALMHGQLVKPGHYVILSVTDNGIGMNREIKGKIFEPFFTTKGTGKGTGLGLSTTYGIIEQHNGYIWAYSEPGKGTTFKVYLPATEEEAKEIKKDEPSITVEGTETILVVDDQPLIRQFIIDVLQPRGYKLYEADSGEEALKIAEHVKVKIDLLLTDLVMPGMKGSELRKLFIQRWPGIKVCLMSGYGDREMLGEGMEDIIFIQKPLTPGKLTTKLREVLDLND